MTSPLLSAIVLNFGTPKETVRCVKALLNQSIADRMEILIVDNHSDDESIQWIRNSFKSCHPELAEGRHDGSMVRQAHHDTMIRILETSQNLGYGQGNQKAINQARGEYLLIINPDNELEPTGAEKMIDAMKADATIGLLAPTLVHEDGSIRDSVRSFPTFSDIFIKRTLLRHLFRERMYRYLRHGSDLTKVQDVDWVAGACMLMRKDFYDQVGGFDPRFFLFFEDTDLCRRIWKAGKRVVYYPLVCATDRKHRLSQGGVLTVLTKKTVRIHLKSAMQYFWKWKGVKAPSL